MTEVAAEAAAVLVAANLFLRPRTVGALVEYWLRHYTPPILLPGDEAGAAPAVEPDPGVWLASLVRQLLRGPTELALVGRACAAGTAEGAPHWLHWMQLVELAPGVPDTTLTVLVPFFAQQRFWPLCRSLARLYQHVAHGWNVRSAELARAGTLAGECFYTSFRHLPVLERYYPRTLFVVEALYRFGSGLVHALAPHQLQPIGGPRLLAAIAPLAERGEAEYEPGLAALHRVLAEHCTRDVGSAVHLLAQLRLSLGRVARQLYTQLRDECGYPRGDLPEDMRTVHDRPWQPLPARGTYKQVASWQETLRQIV